MIRYPLVSSPFDQIDIDIMLNTIRAGQLTMGSAVKNFETAFAKKIGSKFAVMTNSGSSANLIAAFAYRYTLAQTLNIGDEVIVPAIGWATTWAPLQQAGYKLKVVDVDPETLNVSFDSYLAAITDETKMIVTVSILGNPLEFGRLSSLCKEKNIILFEDTCESIGSQINGQYCGTFGHVGTFSFFYTHHISTMEGGMVVTDDPELYHVLLSLRAHGWVRDLPQKSSLATETEIENKNHYCFALPGFNVRPLEISGAVGLNQLKKLDDNIKVRRANALEFNQRMMRFKNRYSFQTEKYGESSWYSFTIVIKNGTVQSRDALMNHFLQLGIESRMITGGCLTLHPMKKYFSFSDFERPVIAEQIHNSGLFVANHASDMASMFDVLEKALDTFEKPR